MIKHEELAAFRRRSAAILSRTGVAVRRDEIDSMEVLDFGLNDVDVSGVQILTLVDTDRIAVKLLVLLPNQVEPEHKHPPVGEYPGKEETIRCEFGELYLYGPGEPSPNPRGHPPESRREMFTVWHERVLLPGDQTTFQPNTPHWFQGGPQGAVIWSFSTKSIAVHDIFTDPDVRRETEILEE